MGEHLTFVDDSESPGYPDPSLRPKRDRRQTFGRVRDRRPWPYHLMYAALLVGQAVAQIGLVLMRPF
jgi:hypothetical protein